MTTDRSILNLSNDTPRIFTLESEKGHGIYGIYTVKYARGLETLESISMPSTMHQVTFPNSEIGTLIFENTVTLSKVT